MMDCSPLGFGLRGLFNKITEGTAVVGPNLIVNAPQLPLPSGLIGCSEGDKILSHRLK
jgi:hypothetical protein